MPADKKIVRLKKSSGAIILLSSAIIAIFLLLIFQFRQIGFAAIVILLAVAALSGIAIAMISRPAFSTNDGSAAGDIGSPDLYKGAQKKLLNANRLYFFISHINQMIVKTTDEATLFQEACMIATNFGNFRMAWIGMIDEQSKKIVPVSYAGDEQDYLLKIKPISLEDVPEGRGPTGQALSKRTSIFCNDIENDPEMAPWKEAALGRGYLASIALPIIKFGEVVGAFTLYASTKNFFDTTEVGLLEEATANISFAMENFEKERLRKKAEEELLKSEKRYQTLAEVSPVGIFHTDATGYTTYVNPRWSEISGLPREKALGNGWLNAVHEDDRNELLSRWSDATDKRNKSFSEYRFVLPDGTIAWVMGQATPELNNKNEIIGYVGTITEITERKKNEEETEKREKRFRTTLDKMLEGIQIYDFDWNCIYVNDTVVTQGPYSKEEIMAKKLTENYPGIENTELFVILERCRHEKIAKHLEYEFTFPDNSKKWFELSIQPNPEGLFILSVDISERKQAEEEINRFNTRLVLSQKMTRIAYWEMDLVGNNHYWPDESHLLLGIDEDNTITDIDSFLQRVHPDDKNILLQKYKEVISNKQVLHAEFRFVERNGGFRDYYSVASLQLDANGQPVRMLGTTQDITDRKRIEQEILKEKQLSDSIINSLPGIFYLYNREGKFFRWNKNFETISQYSAAEIANLHPLNFFDGADKEIVRQTIDNVFAQGNDTVQANFHVKNGDNIPYYFTGISIEYESQTCLMGVGIDFSDRVKAQEIIKRSAEELRELTTHLLFIREEERKRIAREIHDELGQQLTAIKMDIAWIDKKIPDETNNVKSKLKNIIGLLDGSNLSLRRILSELRPAILDEHDLLSAMDWQGRQFSANTGIPFQLSSNAARIEPGEQIATTIFRIFQEALTNITRYAEARQVHATLNHSGDLITLEIEDNGKGFDTCNIKTSKSFGILGMRERVRSIGGEFELISAPGKGTTIRVRVPFKTKILSSITPHT